MGVKNGISAISNEVLGDVQKETEAIISTAENQAKESLKKAKEDADKNYLEIVNKANVKAEAEKRKIASVTEVERRNRLLQSKETLVDDAFEKALVKLTAFVKTKEYQKYLLKLVEGVAKQVGQKNLVISVNAQDNDWLNPDVLKRLSKKTNLDLSLSSQTIDCIGGCIIQTSDGKIISDNTIDNRLQELKPVLRVEVAKILFPEA
jgi:V/A-type H+/Na+-transporting ATPase subunit E